MSSDWDRVHASRVRVVERHLQPDEEVFDSGIALDSASAEKYGQKTGECILFATDRRLLLAQETESFRLAQETGVELPALGGDAKVSYLYPHIVGHHFEGKAPGFWSKRMVVIRLDFRDFAVRFIGGDTFFSSVSGILRSHQAKPHHYSKTVAVEPKGNRPYCGHCGYVIRQMYGYCSACGCAFSSVVAEGDQFHPASGEDLVEVRPQPAP